jgi:hypothetical protein
LKIFCNNCKFFNIHDYNYNCLNENAHKSNWYKKDGETNPVILNKNNDCKGFKIRNR